MRRMGILSGLAICICSVACVHSAHEEGHTHWAYGDGDGPPAWGELSAEYRGCSAGRHQSPVDIKASSLPATNLPRLAIHYGPRSSTEENNGHTIQDTLAPGDFIAFGDARFDLEQFHFHHPSEHTLNGTHFPLEIHFVHHGPSGQRLIVAVFVTEGPEHPVLHSLFERLPHGYDAIKLSADPAPLLPAEKRYVEYEGSLTTPPCTEGVTWVVMTTPVYASADQIQRFAALFPHNNRPLMPLNGRQLLSSQGR
jgi:carbonic anhydrase